MISWRGRWPVHLLLLLLSMASPLQELQAHSTGLYATRAEAAAKARQLGCEGTHRNDGLWMPCRDEASLHRALRDQR